MPLTPTKPMFTRLQKIYADIGAFKETREYRLTQVDRAKITKIRFEIRALERELKSVCRFRRKQRRQQKYR